MQGDTVPTDDLVADPTVERREFRLEAGGVDDAVDVVVLSIDHQTPVGDLLDAGGAVDQGDVVVVEGQQILVVETRAFAQVAVIRLENLGLGRIGHQLIDPAPVEIHDLVVEYLAAAQVLGHGHVLAAWGVLDGGVVMGPSVIDQIHVGGLTQHDGLEVVHPIALPTRSEGVGEVRVGGSVAPFADGRGGALEDIEVFGRLGQRRHDWMALAPLPMRATDVPASAVRGSSGPPPVYS